MVFQEPGATLNPLRKIKTQFYETMRAHERVTRRKAAARALDLLVRLNLPSPARLLEAYPFQLSGGMKQRVAIALAIVLHPLVLLADEPTSALDVLARRQITDELVNLRDAFGTVILLVTHNIGVVRRMADKVAVMYGGRIVEYGYRNDILRAPAHPYTRALMAAVPALDGRPPIGIAGTRGKERFCAEGCAFAPRCVYATPDCPTRALRAIPLNPPDGVHWTLCAKGAQ
jgi:peptide/nickel transport system ATP-binding protein